MGIRILRDWLYQRWIALEIDRFKARGGTVIMITGSYGKTSVRELAHDLLRRKYQTLETSRNYNTAVGIAKTLRWEMTRNVEVFIVEVGAYRVGEIMGFCRVLKPNIGVITGIAKQHLFRFGSWEKIIEAKTEIARYMESTGGILVANGGDETVKKEVKEARWYPTSPTASLGASTDRNEINKSGAKEIGRALGMSEDEIKDAAEHFRSVPSRFEGTSDRYGMNVIDDSYNSNEKSFVDAVTYLSKQKKYTRILVTPGLIELGSESQAIHKKLGRMIVGKCDLVILVGKNERTDSMANGINNKIKILWIEKTLQFMKVVKDLKLQKEPLVLLENDVPELH